MQTLAFCGNRLTADVQPQAWRLHATWIRELPQLQIRRSNQKLATPKLKKCDFANFLTDHSAIDEHSPCRRLLVLFGVIRIASWVYHVKSEKITTPWYKHQDWTLGRNSQSMKKSRIEENQWRMMKWTSRSEHSFEGKDFAQSRHMKEGKTSAWFSSTS